jgi:hypothetical protein
MVAVRHGACILLRLQQPHGGLSRAVVSISWGTRITSSDTMQAHVVKVATHKLLDAGIPVAP